MRETESLAWGLLVSKNRGDKVFDGKSNRNSTPKVLEATSLKSSVGGLAPTEH